MSSYGGMGSSYGGYGGMSSYGGYGGMGGMYDLTRGACLPSRRTRV